MPESLPQLSRADPAAEGPWLPLLKGARNLIADAAASCVAQSPALEPAFIRLGKNLHDVPWFHTLYRRSRDTLVEKLKAKGDSIRKIRVHTVEILFDVSQFTVKRLYFLDSVYEPATTRLFLDEIVPNDVVLDVGANAGYFTLLAATRVGPAGRVYAFEPNPAVLVELKNHVALNHVEDRVTVVDAAVSDQHESEADLFISQTEDNSGLSSLIPTSDGLLNGVFDRGKTARVRTISIDDWRVKAGCARIDWIKIDVEGFEENVTRGMLKTLRATPVKGIICETRPQSPAYEILLAQGYSAERLGAADPHDWSNFLFRPRPRPAGN